MTDAINEIVQTSELALSNGDRLLQIGLIAIAGGFGFLGGVVIIPALRFFFSWFTPQFLTETYMRVVIASKSVVLTLIGVFCINPRKRGLCKIRFSITRLKTLSVNKKLSQKLYFWRRIHIMSLSMSQNTIL